MHIFGPIIFILIGLFSIICSVKEVSWFFNHRKSRVWINIIGYKATKIFYIILGVLLMILGVGLLLAFNLS